MVQSYALYQATQITHFSVSDNYTGKHFKK